MPVANPGHHSITVNSTTNCHIHISMYINIYVLFTDVNVNVKATVLNIPDRSQRHFAHVTTVTLSWRVQNIVVIGRVYFTLECFEFSSNFEFDRNMLSGTGAWTSRVNSRATYMQHKLVMVGPSVTYSTGQMHSVNFDTVEPLYNTIVFHKNTHKRHPIARP